MEAFVATGIVSATIVDVTRLLVYGSAISVGQFAQIETLALPVAVGTLAALIGSLLAKRLLEKVTLPGIQMLVAIAMLGVGFALMLGVL